MKKSTAKTVKTEAQIAMRPLDRQCCTRNYPAFVGLDVHKDTITWAIALEGRSEAEYRGEIANRPKKVEKLVQRLAEEFDGQVLLWCYEAGPCGYVLHRQLLSLGHDCQVVAPSKIPHQAGGTGEDGSTGCDQAVAVAAQWGSKWGVGARY